MFMARRNPAVVAGLLGALGVSVPSVAEAATPLQLASDLGRDALANPAVTFALGCVTGAAIVGVTAAARRKGEKDAQAEEAEEAPTLVLNVAARSGNATVGAPSNESAVPAPSYQACQDHPDEPVADVATVGPEDGVSHPARSINQEIASRVPSVDRELDDTNDYVNVAEDYVEKQTLRERMAARARGVADVLQERLGADKFEGLPIIERADGTVGDVGTSWWDARLGDSVRHVGEKDVMKNLPTVEETSNELSVPTWMGEASHEAAPAAEERPLTPAMEFSRSRAARIAQSVPEVDQGKYPEHRDADALDHEDLWNVALQAMDEKIDNGPRVAPFVDVIGGADTIDDPTGLEDPTKFIPFRTPAGHPEVVDTESYVDYLINDEFSRNESQAARRSSREYLHVIEGGSQNLANTAKLPKRNRPKRGAYKPRHMAAMVREA
ncbi:MAG: hypothetical protein ACI38Z_02950 [Parafannyhessea sp.]|uniref:hypothetical protein n=1 Tax=Parafannyhessea sp. TaxID=2847324 RepID=UPI003EFF0A81